MSDNPLPGADGDAASRPIESWEDLIDDDGWWTDGDAGDPGDAVEPAVAAAAPVFEVPLADKSDLMVRFALADVVAQLWQAMNQIMNQPTMDFEWQYQAGYQVFAQASAHLDQESQRVESAGAEFQPVVGHLRANIERQRSIVAAQLDDHADRHRRYRAAMIPVNADLARDRQKSAQAALERQQETYLKINEQQAEAQRRRVQASDDRHRDWLRNHLR